MAGVDIDPGDSVTATDERRHPPTEDRRWEESWWFDFVAPDGSLGGFVRIALQPHRRRSSYWAALVRDGHPLVTVLEHDAPLPGPPGLEVRADGLWCDHICETPLDHWTIGLEAFGLGLDDPGDVFGRCVGDPVPLGFDLEWETAVGVESTSNRRQRGGGEVGYGVACTVFGEVLVGSERLELDGFGHRAHHWGVRDWVAPSWSGTGHLDDGTVVDAVESAPLTATVRHVAPVAVDGDDGRVARVVHALCRYDAPDGRAGHGWGRLIVPDRNV